MITFSLRIDLLVDFLCDLCLKKQDCIFCIFVEVMVLEQTEKLKINNVLLRILFLNVFFKMVCNDFLKADPIKADFFTHLSSLHLNGM